MRTVLVIILSMAFCAIFVSSAGAQTRAGIDVARVVPAHMEIVDVRVPDQASIPVRLSLAPIDGQGTELIVDVLVAPDATAARRALEWQMRTMQGTVAPATGLGDQGFADDGYAVFVRDNVLVVIRRVHGALDVGAHARRVDGAIAVAPVGPTRAATQVPLPDLTSMGPDETARVAIPNDALDMHIAAIGDVAARRTRDGYLLARTGESSARLVVIIVDRLLRTNL